MEAIGCDTTVGLQPCGTPYGRGTGGQLVEQFQWRSWPASPRNPDLLMKRNGDTLTVGSTMGRHRGYHPEDFCRLPSFGTVAGLFSVIAQESNLYKEAVQK